MQGIATLLAAAALAGAPHPPVSEGDGAVPQLPQTWTPISTVNAPPDGCYAAVWTGSRMIVWGAAWEAGSSTGGVYDPATDSWSAISTLGAPNPRCRHKALWTGSRMIVFGGQTGEYLTDGGSYDPTTDTWTPIAAAPVAPTAPVGLNSRLAFWTGRGLYVWGSSGYPGYPKEPGAFWDEAATRWTIPSWTDAPKSRDLGTGVWTGTHVIVWGGYRQASVCCSMWLADEGGIWDAAANAWQPIHAAGPDLMPGGYPEQTPPSAVWTGSRMLALWDDLGSRTLVGASYDPVADSWTPTRRLEMPNQICERYEDRLTLWAGNRLFVWAGCREPWGALYDPASDSWSALSLRGAPFPDENAPLWTQPTAVWTGTEVLLWYRGRGARWRVGSR